MKSIERHDLRHVYLRLLILVLVALITANVLFYLKLGINDHAINQRSEHVLLKPTDRVLVTGAAGFIGYHLLSQLKKQGLDYLIGLDSFEPYYSPAYKYQRFWRLRLDHNIDVIHGSVCDAELLSALFREHNLTHVVHLSASANVRFSVEEPQKVIKNNIVCFQNLLEQLRAESESGKTVPHLAFASSSSVYGMNEIVPFEVTHNVDKPASLYGASKRMNELQAKVYNHIFKISSVGLRFFTVYGPWGRPDMAPYMFTEKIINGEAITVFNEGMMKRDFTFIDDIVRGIVASMEFRSAGFQPVNLGNTQPVALGDFISTIEELVGRKARKVYKDSNVDLAMTYSSNTVSKKLLDWAPTVSIEDGMASFVEWFKTTNIALLPCASECAASRQCSSTPYDHVIKQSKVLTSSCEVVVYAIRGVFEESINNEESMVMRHDLEEALNIEGACNLLFAGEFTRKVDRDKKGWRVVDVASFKSSDSHGIRYLPKFNPRLFFSKTVTIAVFTEGRYPDTNIILEKIKCRGLIEAMPALAHDGAIARTYYSESQISKYTEARQDDAYRADTKSALNISTSLLVHNIDNYRGKEIRCQWMNELIVWESTNDGASLSHVLHRMQYFGDNDCIVANLNQLQ